MGESHDDARLLYARYGPFCGILRSQHCRLDVLEQDCATGLGIRESSFTHIVPLIIPHRNMRLVVELFASPLDLLHGAAPHHGALDVRFSLQRTSLYSLRSA